MVGRSDEEQVLNLAYSYIDSFQDLRDQHQTLNNFDFNDKYGLYIRGPWDFTDCVASIALRCMKKSILLVYPSAQAYVALSECINQKAKENSTILDESMIKYISWQDIFVAIHSSGRDARPVRHVRTMLEGASNVVVLNASGVEHLVLDSIKTYCDRCLICLG